MTYWFKAFGLTIDAHRWARAGEAGAVGFGVDALEAVIFGQVMTTTKGTDDGVFGATAVLNVMAKRVAKIALFNKREGVKEFDDAGAAEEEKGTGKKAFKPGPILV